MEAQINFLLVVVFVIICVVAYLSSIVRNMADILHSLSIDITEYKEFLAFKDSYRKPVKRGKITEVGKWKK